MAEDIQPAQPEMTAEEFSVALAHSRRPVPGTTRREPLSLTPATDEALEKGKKMAESGRQTLETGVVSPDMQKLGAVPGVQMKSGVDTWSYLMYKTRENEEDQMRYLASKFGAENVRINELGKPVVRISDPETGETADHTVDPYTMDMKTLLGWLRFAPEFAATALTLRGKTPETIAKGLSKIPGLGGLADKGDSWLFKSALGAAATETVGALKQVGTQLYDRPVVDLSGIIGEHALNVPLDMTLDMGMIKGAQGVKWAMDLVSGKPVSTPAEAGKRWLQSTMRRFADETELSKSGKAAMQYFDKKGVPYKPTIGETTDIPLIAMAEGYMARQVAGATAIKARVTASEESNRAIQRYMLGSGTLPLDEEVGRRGIAALKQAYDAASQTVKTQQDALGQKVVQSAQKDLLDYFSLSSLPERGYPLLETGDFIRGMGTKTRDVFWDRVGKLYGDLYAHPAAAERTVETGGLIGRVKKLLKELPSVEQRTSGVGYDAYGSPIEVEETGSAILKEFVPDGVISRLNDLLKLEGQKTSVLDLKAARTDVNDAIKRSLALGTTQNHYLKQIAAALDDTLQEGINSSSAPELRQLFDSATEAYKQGVDKFKDKLISGIWAHPEERIVDNGRLVTSIMNSEARYEAVKKFFGDGSEAVKGFQDTVRKKLFSNALSDIGETVDAERLLREVSGLAKTNPKLYKDVIGDKFQGISVRSQLLGAFKGKVDVRELDELLQRPGIPSRADLQKLIDLENTRTKIYQNAVVKKFAGGEAGAEALDPEDFVRFLGGANKQDVSAVMATLEKEGRKDVVEDIRRKTLQDIFRKAARTPTAEDINAQLKGDPSFLVSLKGLQDVLATDEHKAVYKIILGADKYRDLEQYVALQNLPAQKRERAKEVGMMASGTSTGQAIKGLISPGKHLGSELSEWAKLKTLSIFMSRDWGIDALKALEGPLPPPIISKPLDAQLGALIISSQPFVKALGNEFRDPLVRFQVASWLKRRFGVEVGEGETDKPMTAEEFDKAMQPPAMP